MKKPLLSLLTGALLLAAMSCTPADQQADTPPAAPAPTTVEGEENPLRPIMLDAVQYYVNDPEAFDPVFLTYMQAGMPQQAEPALPFLRLYQFRPGQPTLQLSAPGPWPGLREQQASWERTRLEPRPENALRYGVYWVAFATRSLAGTIGDLSDAGVSWLSQSYRLPQEPTAQAALMWGPDYTQMVFVERPGDRGATPYAIDHLMLLVEDMAAQTTFFQDALGGEVVQQEAHLAMVMVGGIPLVLAEPEALGLKRQTVARRDPAVFRPGIEQLAFLYRELEPVTDYLREAGFPLTMPPTRLVYAEKETPYTMAQTLTPDSLPILLIQEEGRLGPREMPAPDP
ncbi:MAG: VOC family protein, partial [Bacteroidetes bacterium]